MVSLMRKILTLLLGLWAAGSGLRAQIFTQGSDPGRLRWRQAGTPHYRLIYPEGADSLARVYGASLEQFREATGRSIGMLPGAFQKSPLPVVLHTCYGYSNGSMFWAPRRMDLFTRMDPYGSDPTPWVTQLTVHEPRHLAQLQAGYRLWRPLNVVFGELWPAAVWALYPNQALSEGDAVAFETAVTGGARTRTADFLNYFRVAFDVGDWRNWYRWRYGSFKHYTPDYYKVGYLTVAGMRYFYDDPLFMKRYFDGVVAHPLRPGHRQRSVREASGKPFKEAFREIMEGFQAVWSAEERGLSMPMEQLTFADGFATDYTCAVWVDGRLYALREGLADARELVILDDGKVRAVRPFSTATSSLFFDPVLHRLYWSETIGDRRWDLAHTSRIRFLDTRDFQVHDLTLSGRFYNPQPSPDGRLLSVVEYPYEGGSAVRVLDASDGHTVRRYTAPDGIQACETAWLGDVLYVSGVEGPSSGRRKAGFSDQTMTEEGGGRENGPDPDRMKGGYGLYRLMPDGRWETELPPVVAKMVNLGNEDGAVSFVADRNGENELYTYRPADGTLTRMTTTRYGATDFCEADGWLYYSSQTLEGKMLFRTALDDLQPVAVDPAAVHRYVVEDALTAQEKALAGDAPLFPELDLSVVTSPQPYRKLPNLVHFHSWAPVYFDYVNLSSLSGDFSYQRASPGVTGLFQNELGTLSGTAGYGAHPDPDGGSAWRHSLHAQFTYTGLYPVIEGRIDFNDRANAQYRVYDIIKGTSETRGTDLERLSSPSVEGLLTAYLPLNFSSGGYLRGWVPRISWTISNSWFNTSRMHLERPLTFTGLSAPLGFTSVETGRNVLMQKLTASMRGYMMLSRAESQVYPRFGIGAEAGWSGRPGLMNVFTPSVYGYLYGYLPGFTRVQGLRLTAIAQHQLDRGRAFGENHVTVMPRGFSSEAGRSFALRYPTQARATADYAIPVYIGDISWFSPVAYIKNLLAIPHVDFTVFGGASDHQTDGTSDGNLCSVGIDLTVELANLAWFPFGCSIGLSVDYLGGASYPDLASDKPWYTGLIFSLDL